MKRNSLLLVAFLLCLYIGPSVFISSYASSAILTGPNMSKEFSPATEYETSDQSITSFSETLPDDVLYYPDSFSGGLSDPMLATGGNNTAWEYSHDDDGVYYSSVPASSSSLEFTLDVSGIETIYYHFSGTGGSGTFSIWNGSIWESLETITADTWYNGSVSGNQYLTYNNITFLLSGYSDCDYLEIQYTFDYMTGAESIDSATHFSDYGDTGYDNTFALDTVNMTITGTGDLYFIFDNYVTGFDYQIYMGIDTGATGDNGFYDDGGYKLIGPITDGWNNGTIEDITIADGLLHFETVASYILYGVIYIDYIAISNIVHGRGGYAESFADVSDWSFGAETASFGSDGDIGVGVGDWVTGADYIRLYTDAPSLSSGTYYFEIRWNANVTFANSAYIRLYTEDAQLGTYTAIPLGYGSSWSTIKGKCESAIESIQIYFIMVDTDVEVYIDYLRISPSTSMGWQHDGSTTDGISSADGGIIASDGDLLTLTADGDGSTFLIVADTTTTAGAISTTYYPFFAIDIDSGSGSWTLEQYDGSAYATLQSSTAITAGIDRFNMASLDTYVSWWRITLTASSVLIGDWAKAYSIANFTYDDGGAESTNDYSYVEDGKLVIHTDTYTKWNYDPTLSVAIGTYDLWSVSLSYGDEYFRFRELGDTPTLWDTGITSGELVGTTLEDFDILLYGNMEISAITFKYQLPEWAVVGEADLIFVVPIDEWAMDMFLIFLGLFMIPSSTIYLAWGGRKNMSIDKVFFGLVAFILGWAFFIGGIMI